MKFIPTNIKDLKEIAKPYSDNYRILTDFANGNQDCVKVVDYTHKNAKSCYTSLANSINRYRKGTMKAIMRGDDVYLVKTIALKN